MTHNDTPVNISIHRREITLHGNAHDISRVANACKKKLRQIEFDHMNPNGIHVVTIPAPHEDEP